MQQKFLFCLVFFFLSSLFLKAQVLTKEDSLNAGLIAKDATTVLSGYGEIKYMYNVHAEQGTINITRNILFLGHKFNNTFSLFSETELENAKVAGGQFGGELSLEQLFIKSNLTRDMYLVTGLFIPRIGIINENHLPTTFYGNDRPFVEQLVIPTTWRELGVGLFGQMSNVPGLNYYIGLTNGLKASNFNYSTGIKDGRQEGSIANANNLALSTAVLYYIKNFRFQASGYYGGTSGLRKKTADSLGLESGLFALPLALVEANVQYQNNGISFKALACIVQYSKAQQLNQAYGKNTSSQLFGAYAEIAYNVLQLYPATSQALSLFVRYEQLNLQNQLPNNALKDDLYKQQYFVAGISYQPIKAIVFKLDYVLRNTGNYNPALHIFNPYEYNDPVFVNNHFVNLGLAYSF